MFCVERPVVTCVDVPSMAAEKVIGGVLVEGVLQVDDMSLNMCLMLHNVLDVKVFAFMGGERGTSCLGLCPGRTCLIPNKITSPEPPWNPHLSSCLLSLLPPPPPPPSGLPVPVCCCRRPRRGSYRAVLMSPPPQAQITSWSHLLPAASTMEVVIFWDLGQTDRYPLVQPHCYEANVFMLILIFSPWNLKMYYIWSFVRMFIKR